MYYPISHDGAVCPACTIIAARALAEIEKSLCPSCECRTLRVEMRDGQPYAVCMNCAWVARGRLVGPDDE